MAKKALFNLVVGSKSFEKGKVYADEEVTKEIDESSFVEVSNAALEAQNGANEEVDGEEVKAPKKRGGKKVPGESEE
jgi:hypothetical protein